MVMAVKGREFESKEKKIVNFRELKIWQLGKEIAIDVFKVTEPFSRTEYSGLSSQMRRSAVSVPSNVAEGFNRFHVNEYRQFLFVALGSCAELETQLEIGATIGLIKQDRLQILLESINHESRMIRSLINKLKQEQ